MLLRSLLALAITVVLLPGAPARADEGDLSFLLLLAGGFALAAGGGLCLGVDDDGEGYDKSGFYVGVGASWAHNNFQQKGPGGALAPRRFNTLGGDSSGPVGRANTPIVGGIFPGLSNGGGVRNAFLSRAEGLDVTDGDTWGITGRAGYRCNPLTALEAHFEYLHDDFNMKFETSGQVFLPAPRDRIREVQTDTETWTGGVNAKFYAMRGRVQPYALAGLGIMRIKEASVRNTIKQELNAGFLPAAIADCRISALCNVSFFDSDQFKDIDLAARFGGGVEIYLTENLAITAEASYVRPTGRVEAYDFYSVGGGIQWKFGKDTVSKVRDLFVGGEAPAAAAAQ